MKKILFAIAIVLTFGLSANAQGRNDEFINEWGGGNRFSGDEFPSVPFAAVGISGNVQSNPDTPLGSGLMVLTALGAGYAVARKRKK